MICLPSYEFYGLSQSYNYSDLNLVIAFFTSLPLVQVYLLIVDQFISVLSIFQLGGRYTK